MNRIPAQEITQEDIDSRVFNLYEKKEKIYTRRMEGLFQTIRLFTGWPLLLAYFLAPWLQLEGRQAILFDLPARKFHIFWLTLWPQDFVLLMWTLAIAAFALFFITTLWGRVWCGYTCPQTIWTAIFMWAEQITEGERNQRIKLDGTPSLFSRDGWNRAGWNKFWKRGLKHGMWLGFAALTGITFIGYFYDIRQLLMDALAWQLPLVTVAWCLFFTLATYINAGWLREHVCIYMCPYARFQSAMFDRDTLIISYDEARGEARGSRKRNSDYQAMGLGDCIDCTLCVQVCPTGIDIRDGLQYECIGCAHCIDACDSIMSKMNYPKGLISYTTQNRLEGGSWTWKRPKLIAYGGALLLMLFMFALVLLTRTPLSIDVLRDRGTLYQEVAGGLIENVYTLKIINMENQPRSYELLIDGLPEATLLPGNTIQMDAGSIDEMLVRIQLNPDLLADFNTPFRFIINSTESGKQVSASAESRFIGPRPL
ncbi:MAG: cytochrome c oxidase accessory protein CcoG [Pseudomonadales bacterium]|nr:cytochrome c oxidase accessory protein CcoG [Pseudomonadales bacterium]